MVQSYSDLPDLRDYFHLTHEEEGNAGDAFIRLTDAAYADGFGTPYDHGNARDISNKVAAQGAQSHPSQSNASDLFTFYGQFIDHDIDITHTSASAGQMTTPVPVDDPFYTGGEIGITRSEPIDGTGVTGPREYSNAITSFIDGSNIYASSAVVAKLLRADKGDSAYLLTSNGGKAPPTFLDVKQNAAPGVDVDSLGVFDGPSGDHFFVSGDVRINENVALTSMHTVWIKEHNQQVDHLRGQNPDWSEQELFEAAQMIVRAEMQSVVYNEYLPLLVGTHGLPEYTGYKDYVDTGISMEFATAAYRLGHSQISSQIEKLNEDGSVAAGGHLNLFQAFFNPAGLQNGDAVADLMRGITAHKGEHIDTLIVDDVRNLLFGAGPTAPNDLAALNIMRSRDHGLGTLNEVREDLGLTAYASFGDLTSDPVLADALAQAYGHVDQVELWIGGLAEDKVYGSQLGETFQVIVVDQFTRLRDSDPAYYENIFADSPEIVDFVEYSSFSDILVRNTDIEDLQHNAFIAHNRVIGTNGDDDEYGSHGIDFISAKDGHDTVYARGGDDDVRTGAGEDHVYAGAGDDNVETGADNDYARGQDGNDTIYGEDGDDKLIGDKGNDALYGGDGEDWQSGGAGRDRLFGGNDDDMLIGGKDDDFLAGNHGDDNLRGNSGADRLNGGHGDDYINGGADNDVLWGHAGNDYIVGGHGDDEVHTGLGDDTAYTGQGNDDIYIGPGADKVFAGQGNDEIWVSDADFGTVHGGDGRYDILRMNSGFEGDLDLRAGSSASNQVTHVEVLDIKGGFGDHNTAKVDYDAVASMSSGGNYMLEKHAQLDGVDVADTNMMVRGNAGDKLELEEGWVYSGETMTMGGQEYDVINYYEFEDVVATLAVDSDVAVVIPDAGDAIV